MSFASNTPQIVIDCETGNIVYTAYDIQTVNTGKTFLRRDSNNRWLKGSSEHANGNAGVFFIKQGEQAESYYIESAVNNHFLSVDSTNVVFSYREQRWAFQATTGGYCILNIDSGLYLTLSGYEAATSASCVAFEFFDYDYKLPETGTYILHNLGTRQNVIDVENSPQSITNGANLHIWTVTRRENDVVTF